jgi:hypothetical protein
MKMSIQKRFGGVAAAGLLLLGAIASIAAFVWSDTSAMTVVPSSSQARLEVQQNQQPQFTQELKDYAVSRSLYFSSRMVPAPWLMIEVTMKTPKGNEISVINATAIDEFSATITVFNRDEDWKYYWLMLRRHVSAHYKWKEIP